LRISLIFSSLGTLAALAPALSTAERDGTALKSRAFPAKRVCCTSLADIIDNIGRTATFSLMVCAKIQEIRAFGGAADLLRLPIIDKMSRCHSLAPRVGRPRASGFHPPDRLSITPRQRPHQGLPQE
jgi:hypothetical protein